MPATDATVQNLVAAMPMSHESRPLDGLKLLVVEDEPDARLLLLILLERSGAEVTAVGSAAEGLAELGKVLPDIILSDIEMPGEDGYGFMKHVRGLSDLRLSSIPAVALTAHARIEDRVAALSAGYDTHVAKPFEPAELLATISRLTSRRSAQHDEDMKQPS
jgi:CheY-like chemotaxis protein